MLVSDGVIVWEVQEENGKEIARAMRGYHYVICCSANPLTAIVGQPLIVQLEIKDWQGNATEVDANLIVKQGEDSEVTVPVVSGIAEFDFIAEYVGKIQLTIRAADMPISPLELEVVVG